MTDPRRRTGLLAVTAVGIFVTDLVTKVLVVAELMGREPVRLLGGALYLTHARNPGAAFSFAESATVLFTVVAAVVVAVIVRTASRLRSTPWAVCLGLILGGATGNLVDRIFRSPSPLRGHVVDWISVFDPYGRVWPIFNVADSGIVVGGVLAVLLATLGHEMDGSRTRRRRGDGNPPDSPPSGPPAGAPPTPRPADPADPTDPAGPPGPAPGQTRDTGPHPAGSHPGGPHPTHGGRRAPDGYLPSSGPLARPGPGSPAPSGRDGPDRGRR